MGSNKSFIFGGDICLGEEPYVFSDRLVRLFNEHDYAFLNLEGPILDDQSVPAAFKSGPALRQPASTLAYLQKLKVRYLSGANNHIGDYGEAGIANTIKLLKDNDLEFFGAGRNQEEAAREIDLPEAKLSVIAAAEEEFGVAGSDSAGAYSLYSSDLEARIKNLKEKGRLVVIYAHGGGEAVPLPSAYIRERYRRLIDAGAELVIAHHPHVVQGSEEYRGKRIFYSLGNFIHKFYPRSVGALCRFETDGVFISNLSFLPVTFRDGKIDQLADEDKHFVSYLQLNGEVLRDDKLFKALHQEQAVRMYEGYYRGYFSSLFSYRRNLRSLAILLFHLIFGGYREKLAAMRRPSEAMLLNLKRNLSHKDFIATARGLESHEIADLRDKGTAALYDKLSAYISYER